MLVNLSEMAKNASISRSAYNDRLSKILKIK